jgi:hypothetical protein
VIGSVLDLKEGEMRACLFVWCRCAGRTCLCRAWWWELTWPPSNLSPAASPFWMTSPQKSADLTSGTAYLIFKNVLISLGKW